MKKLILTLVIFLLGTITYAQEEAMEQAEKSKKELRAEKKAAKKVERQAADAEALVKSNALLASKQWVLEATRVYNKSGRSFNLDPNINFVSIQEKDGVVQLSFTGLVGWNGVGGITLEGNVTRYEFKEPRKEGIGASVKAFMMTAPRSVDIDIRISSGNFADATIRSNTTSGRIRFTGTLVHPSESSVYKGQRRL